MMICSSGILCVREDKYTPINNVKHLEGPLHVMQKN